MSIANRWNPGTARRLAFAGLCLALAAGSVAVLADQAPARASLVSKRLPQWQHGVIRGQERNWEVIDGLAITEGDIVLGPAKQTGKRGSAQTDSIAISYVIGLWPKVGPQFRIPYAITSGSANLNTALTRFNTTFTGLIQWVPRTTETDYVEFQLDPNDHSGAGRSNVGRSGNGQLLNCSVDCTVGTLLHEMGHATGLYHEHSRSDRDTYLSVLTANLIKVTRAGNFDRIAANAQDIGTYDYASLMHYPAFVDTKNGNPTLESIPAGIPLGLGTSGGYSAGDIDAIQRLYGAVPTRITVTTNPAGLHVIVDGATVTTPQTFDWTLGSTHSLDIPAGAQTIAGINYSYGRWGDATAAAHSIIVAAGRGLVTEPISAPRTTVYTAHFIQLVPFTQTTQGSGSMSVSPAAQAYPPLSGLFYRARQTVTLSATPGAGWRFYEFQNAPYFLPGALSANPKTFVVPDDGINAVNVTAQFTNTAVTTIDSNPTGLPVLVDGGYWIAPKNFAPAYDGGWEAGTTHTLNAFSPAYPYSSTVRFAWQSWSDGGALSHSFTAPAASSTRTATFTPQFAVISYLDPYCAGSLSLSPIAPLNDAFYDRNTPLTLTQTANSDWTFTRWREDLSGTGNPQTINIADELLVETDYNTAADALVLSVLQPASATLGGSAFSLSLIGSGFTTATDVFVNNQYRANTFVNSNRIMVPITTDDLATAGAIQIFVQNYPVGGACIVATARSFTIANAPILGATPNTYTFAAQAAATTSATRTISLRNTGSRAVNIASITASGAFGLSHNCPANLGANKSCKLTVSFTPPAAGSYGGAITIVDDAPDAPHVVNLSGTGVAPLSYSPNSLSFDPLAVGASSAAQTVTLTNNAATASNLSFSASSHFTVAAGSKKPCGATLAAAAKCTLAVRFRPQVSGALSGALTIGYNGSFSPLALRLAGSGTGDAAPPLTFAPASFTFAATALGDVSAARTITVTNTGSEAATLASPIATAPFLATVPAGSSGCGGTLAAGAHCSILVQFQPVAIGSSNGAVSIANSGNPGPQTLSVKGSSVLPVTLAPASLSFALQSVGSPSAAQTVTVTNNRGVATTLGSIVASGQYEIGANSCGSTLPAAGTCSFEVRFLPSVLGSVVGAVTVAYGASYSPQVLTLAGEGR